MINIIKNYINKFSIFNFQFSITAGQTLIEALVALAVAVIVVTAISSVVTSSLSNTQFSKDQNLATHYAEEGMEYMRQIRNQQWSKYETTFLTPTPVDVSGSGPNRNSWVIKCLNKDGTLSERDASGKCTPNVDQFIRTIKVEENSCACGSRVGQNENIRKVTVAVAWTDSKCTLATPTPAPTSTPTPTPIPACLSANSYCDSNNECCSGLLCVGPAGNKKCKNTGGQGGQTQGQGQGDGSNEEETPDCNYYSPDISDPLYCHQTQLTSCFSDVANVSEP